MYFFKNYNKFLTGTLDNFKWEDFHIHRFTHDYDKLLKFETNTSAREFLRNHPEIEEEFSAWIVYQLREEWDGSRC